MGLLDFLKSKKNTAETAKTACRSSLRRSATIAEVRTTCRCCSANCWK